jgi:hypothetical protein
VEAKADMADRLMTHHGRLAPVVALTGIHDGEKV